MSQSDVYCIHMWRWLLVDCAFIRADAYFHWIEMILMENKAIIFRKSQMWQLNNILHRQRYSNIRINQKLQLNAAPTIDTEKFRIE